MEKTTLEGAPDWKVHLEEISAGVYRLVATHTYGSRIDETGADLDLLLQQAAISARQMDADIAKSLEQKIAQNTSELPVKQ